jgi:predicted nucleotidyltransferase
MPRTPPVPELVRRLPSGRVPRAAIRRYVREVVAKFQPERVILFGTHAYGKPDADSDVDLLVVMPAKNELTMMGRIAQAIWAPFPLDLLVRTPENLAKRLAWDDWFLKEVMEKGIVLYDASGEGGGSQS